MEAQRVPIDPNVGIPDLIRTLTSDTKRLAADEIRLAKLEMRDSMKQTGKGVLWLGVAFGIGVVAMVAATVFLSALIGRLVNHHYWVGALVTGALELVLALWLLKKGIGSFREPSYTLEATREEAAETARFVAHPRSA